MTKTPETINNADLTKNPTGTVNLKLHFNHKIVNYQCFTYKVLPAYEANVPTAIVDRDYYQTFKGDIDEIQIFHRVQVSRKILNLIKFGSKENAQTMVHNNKVWMNRVTSQLRFDLKPNKKHSNSRRIWKINGHGNYVNLFQPNNQIRLSIVKSFNILEKTTKTESPSLLLFMAAIFGINYFE
jgi:hypothetical protein